MSTRQTPARTTGHDARGGRRTRADRRGVTGLGVAWSVAAAVTAVPAYLLTAVSDQPADRVPGTILALLVAAAAVTALGLVVAPTRQARVASLLTSSFWLAGAAAVYPTQEFAADALWAAGIPALAAVVTGGIALRSRGADGRDASVTRD